MRHVVARLLGIGDGNRANSQSNSSESSIEKCWTANRTIPKQTKCAQFSLGVSASAIIFPPRTHLQPVMQFTVTAVFGYGERPDLTDIHPLAVSEVRALRMAGRPARRARARAARDVIVASQSSTCDDA